MKFKSLITLTLTAAMALPVSGYADVTPTAAYSKLMVGSRDNDWKSNTKVLWSLQWDYVPGLVCKSFLKAYSQYPEEAWAQEALAKVSEYAETAYSANMLATSKIDKWTLDDLSPSKMLFDLYDKAVADGETAKAEKYKASLDYIYSYLKNTYSRIKDDGLPGQGGFWHKDSYPNQMWLDGLYMGAAFYAEYLHHFGSAMESDALQEAWDDVTLQFKIIHTHTYDADKQLNYHGWSADPTDSNSFWANQSGSYLGCSSEFWGRGMGWYFAALVDVLEYIPEGDNRTKLMGYYQQVAAGLKRWQDANSGVWYQLLQYDSSTKSSAEYKYDGTNTGRVYSNYFESSASSMFTYSFLKGLRLGYLAENDYRTMANDAYAGLISQFITANSNGTINIGNVCASAGLGPSDKTYRDGSINYYLAGKDVTITSNEGKAIGSFIMASVEYERTGAEVPEVGTKAVLDTPTLNYADGVVTVTNDYPEGTKVYYSIDSDALDLVYNSTTGIAISSSEPGTYVVKVKAVAPTGSLILADSAVAQTSVEVAGDGGEGGGEGGGGEVLPGKVVKWVFTDWTDNDVKNGGKNGLTVATTDVSIKTVSKTYDEVTYTKALNVIGGGNVTNNSRTIKFDVTGPCTIRFAALSTNADEVRYVRVYYYDGSSNVVLAEGLEAPKSNAALNPQSCSYTINSPTTITLISQNSGINFVFIEVTYPAVDPKAYIVYGGSEVPMTVDAENPKRFTQTLDEGLTGDWKVKYVDYKQDEYCFGPTDGTQFKEYYNYSMTYNSGNFAYHTTGQTDIVFTYVSGSESGTGNSTVRVSDKAAIPIFLNTTLSNENWQTGVPKVRYTVGGTHVMVEMHLLGSARASVKAYAAANIYELALPSTASTVQFVSNDGTAESESTTVVPKNVYVVQNTTNGSGLYNLALDSESDTSTSGVDSLEAQQAVPTVVYYTLQGVRVTAPLRPGLYIVDDGATRRKVLVK